MSDKRKPAGIGRQEFTRRQVVGAAVSGVALYGAHGPLGMRTQPPPRKAVC
jgi:hypothetical protein